MKSNNKYNKSEGEESIYRSLLIMNYDTNKTYTENLEEQVILGGPSFMPFFEKGSKVLPKIYQDSKNLGKLVVNLSEGDISDGILDLRNFLFSDTGIITDITISYAGVEFGGPIWMRIIEWLIFSNDFYRYINNIGDEKENTIRCLEDLCIIGLMLTMKGVLGAFSFAVTKIRGKSKDELSKILVENVNVEDIDNAISTVINNTSKLGKLGKWVENVLVSNRERIKKFVSDTIDDVKKIKKITDKTVIKSFFKKTPSAMFKGILLNKLINMIMGSKTFENMLNTFSGDEEISIDDKKLEDNLYRTLRENNPEIFKNIPSVAKIEVIYEENSEPIFKIMNREYVLVDPLDESGNNWKIKLK